MDEITEKEGALGTMDWLEYYRKRRESLTESIGQLKGMEDDEFLGPSWEKNTREIVRSIMDYHDSLQRQVSSLEERVTGFLDKFQKWMDRYGPILEAEYAQFEKVK